MGLLIGLFSGLLLPTLIIVGIVWAIKKLSSGKQVDENEHIRQYTITDEIEIRQKIAKEIRAQSGQFKSLIQKKVVEQMAQTVEYFATHPYDTNQDSVHETENPTKEGSVMTSASVLSTDNSLQNSSYSTPWRKLPVLDGATILLYLGAFFLLASIGLYVALGVGTSLKAILVILLVAGFYIGGSYLYEFTTRLKPVGITFAAIGMATLPMAGMATYFFLLNEQNGALVWFLTSLIGIGLYGHAVRKFKSSLVSYMLVFSTLSVVLSSISNFGLGPYYFIQGIGIAGVINLIVARIFSTNLRVFTLAYERSANFMVPFSVAASVLFASNSGWFEIAMSMMIGAGYYLYLYIEGGNIKYLYSLVSQVLAIVGMINISLGINQSGQSAAITSGILTLIYTFTWISLNYKKNTNDVLKIQIKFIYQLLPILTIVALSWTPNVLWAGLVSAICTSTLIYAFERNILSGLIGSTSVVLLPLSLYYLTFSNQLPKLSITVVYLLYILISILIKYGARLKLTYNDSLVQKYIFIASTIIAITQIIGLSANVQLVEVLIIVALCNIQAFLEKNRSIWFGIYAALGLLLTIIFLGKKQIFAYLLVLAFYNAVIAIYRIASIFHEWITIGLSLLLPVIYGVLIPSTNWESSTYALVYAIMCAVLYILRIRTKVFSISVLVFGYLCALVGFVASGLAGSSAHAIGAIISGSIGLYIFEKTENNRSLAYFVTVMPLLLVFSSKPTDYNLFVLLSGMTLVVMVVAVYNKRAYEALFSTILGFMATWHIVENIMSLPSGLISIIAYTFAFITIITRYFIRRNTFYADSPLLGYGLFIGLGMLYMMLSSWFAFGSGLFIIGFLLMLASYIENKPALIVPSLIAGVLSVIRFCSGYGLSITESTSILLFLSQATYWSLVVSRLKTIRARYARLTMLSVGLTIPLFGLFYFDQSIFSLSLALFGFMLLKEVWGRGLAAREVSILLIHCSLLWWFSNLGINQLQIYTQSTAFVFALFAYIRRRHQDKPSTINQYLWVSVLFFTVPMVLQALTSSNSNYSYLLLFEHILLIAISIIYRRSVFAWWGIVVVVAAVLYQLRKLRYAALAFLGVFIISLAVYFLLRYNKPDNTDK